MPSCLHVLLYVDKLFKCTWIYLWKSKNDFLKKFEKFLKWWTFVEKHWSHIVLALQVDKVSESMLCKLWHWIGEKAFASGKNGLHFGWCLRVEMYLGSNQEKRLLQLSMLWTSHSFSLKTQLEAYIYRTLTFDSFCYDAFMHVVRML